MINIYHIPANPISVCAREYDGKCDINDEGTGNENNGFNNMKSHTGCVVSLLFILTETSSGSDRI